MNLLLLLLSIIVCVLVVGFFLKKKSYLINFTGEQHQQYAEKNNIPLTGGLLILLSSFLIFMDYSNVFLITLFAMFFLGLMSDLKILVSPAIRLFLQVFFIIIFVYLETIKISSLRIIILDYFLNYTIINYLFVSLCFVILINGTNFIDGLDTLSLGYYLLITFFIYKLQLYELLPLSPLEISLLIIALFSAFIFNIFKIFFIGDSGSYLLGFIFGFIMLKIYANNPDISPFFIVLLLWYPCFENLFSIIRKAKLKRSPILPDTKHFHQLLFNYLKKKNIGKITNPLTANMINLYNLTIFYVASKDIYNSQLQIILILTTIFIYSFLYLRLFLFKFKK